MKKQPIIKIRRSAIFVILLALFVWVLMWFSAVNRPVRASSIYQATSTPDFRTPPVTPTPGSPFTTAEAPSFDCPAGLPEGYGNVVPDANWLASCGHCLPTPTAYPTFDGGTTNIECGVGAFGCTRISPNTIYFTGGQGMFDQATSSFEILGQDADLTDVFVYYRYAGYEVHALNTEISEGVQVNQGITDLAPYENYVDYPVNNLPAQYSYEYNDVPRHGHTIVNSLNYQADTYTQDFGCTRIYVSLVALSEFEEFTCPISTGGGSEIPSECDFPEYDFHEAVSVDEGIREIVSEDITCVDLGHMISCDGTYTTQDDCGLCDTGALFRVYWDPPLDTGFYMEITQENCYVGGNSPGGCTGDNYGTVDGGGSCHNDAISAFSFTCEGSDVSEVGAYNMAFYGDGVLVTTEIHLNIWMTEICSEAVEVIPTPGDINQPLTGHVCHVVLPEDLTPDYDFDIVTNYPGACILVPYFGFGDLLDAMFFGLLEVVAPAFVDFLNLYGNFPASTICWHYVDFASQYIFNVSVPLNIFAIAFVTVWFMRKLSSKGA